MGSCKTKRKFYLNIRNLTTSQVISSKDRGYSSTDHGRQSTAHLNGLQTLFYLVNGRKADNQKILIGRI